MLGLNDVENGVFLTVGGLVVFLQVGERFRHRSPNEVAVRPLVEDAPGGAVLEPDEGVVFLNSGFEELLQARPGRLAVLLELPLENTGQ